jgi:hypothetical protein
MPKKIKKTISSSAKRAKKDLQKKMNMFDRLPDECSACLEDFDKKDKEMVKSWRVVVRNDEGLVRLYCPNCWDTAISVVESTMEEK